MEYKDDNSAFPQYKTQPMPGGGVRVEHVGGMSLRDYFAAKAMQAIIQSSEARTKLVSSAKSAEEERLCIAIWAYIQADAMISARSVNNDQ